MRAVLASPLGFLIGVSLGALGGGGSILAVPALVYAAGESPKAATTTSLVVVGVTALGGVVAHHQAGRVRLLPGLLFGLAGGGGSLVGSAWNRAVDDDVLLLAFAALMLIAGWRMWVTKPCVTTGDFGARPRRCRPVADEPVARRALGTANRTAVSTPLRVGTAVRVLAAGTAVGFITGFFGVGGGFVVVPALVLALRFSMPEAVGTSLLVIAVNAAVALTSRLGTTGVDWGVAIPFTIAGLVGSASGKRLADRLPAIALIRWFVVFLVVLAAYVATQAVAGLLGR